MHTIQSWVWLKHIRIQTEKVNSEPGALKHFWVSGLKIMSMSGQDDYLSGQNLGLAAILTCHVWDFQIIN